MKKIDFRQRAAKTEERKRKKFLYDYYMERDCKEEANAIWQDE